MTILKMSGLSNEQREDHKHEICVEDKCIVIPACCLIEPFK